MQGMDTVYINLLIDAMKKKEDLLSKIIDATEQQASCFKAKGIMEDEYDELFELKHEMITQLDKIDEGFDQIYVRVQKELKENKEAYKDQILLLQQLIKSVTDKSMQIQKLEDRNREKFEQYINVQRREIKQYKISRKTASTYYSNMMRNADTQSFLYDKKK